MDFFMSQIGHIMGAGSQPTMFKFGVVLSAIFVVAVTILETGQRGR